MSRRSRLFVTTAVQDWGRSPLSRVPNTDIFTPADLSPDLWLDASDATTITASNGSVSQWNNKGSKSNFSQGTGNLQPATGATTLNGFNVIDFDGDYLTAATTNDWKFLHDGTNYIVAAVWKPTAAEGSGNYGLMGSAYSATHVGMSIYWGSNGLELYHDAYRGVSGTVAARGQLSSYGGSITRVLTILADPDNATANNRIEFFVDGGSGTKNVVLSDPVSTANPTNAFQMGAAGANNVPFKGFIAEVVIVSGTGATEANRVKLRDYLNTKWAVY